MGKQKRETTFSAHAVIEHPRGTGRFVLIEETAPHKRGKFNIPGGNEDEEDLSSLPRTAARETKEETGAGVNPIDPNHGLDVVINDLIAVYPHEKRPKHRIAIFSGFVASGIMRPTSEHPIVDAYSIEEIDEFYRNDMLRHPRVHHAIHAYLGGLTVPINLLAPQQIRESAITEL
jgi:8-oxo-dGTP pyrophosphatase MutT (NUDIX family)